MRVREEGAVRVREEGAVRVREERTGVAEGEGGEDRCG